MIKSSKIHAPPVNSMVAPDVAPKLCGVTSTGVTSIYSKVVSRDPIGNATMEAA